MDHNYYKITDVYMKKVIGEANGSPDTNSSNSYQTVASMIDPGKGPIPGSNGQNAEGGNRVMFPNEEDIDNDEKASMLIRFFKTEIDDGSWNKKTKIKFKEMFDFLLGYKEPQKDKTEEQLMKAARKTD